MKYKELAKFISELSDDQLDMEILIYLDENICGGYFKVDNVAIADVFEEEDSHIQPNQPYIII
jgi:hypothetical protein